jgi:hypothetical protein
MDWVPSPLKLVLDVEHITSLYRHNFDDSILSFQL